MPGSIYNFRYFVEALLGEKKGYDFALWAFGEGFEDKTSEKLPELWNSLHGHNFILRSDGNVESDLLKMIDIWEKQI